MSTTRTEPVSAAPETAEEVTRRGLMLVLSSPSGAGKTTISRRLLAEDPGITMSVSVTTRAMRPGEVEGIDYYFVSREAFDGMITRSEMLEHAEVFENCYGTPQKPVQDALASGRDVLFDIDWQGTQQLAESARADLVTIFILPPSAAELERRLNTRAQDSAEIIARRMEKAADEMSHYFDYDYVIINREVEESVRLVRTILDAERQKRHRQIGLAAFVRRLQHGS